MSEVIAKVGYKELTEENLQMFISALPREQQMYASHPQMREQIIEQMKQYYMLALEGEAEKLDETEEYKKHMEGIRYDLLQQMVLRDLFAKIVVNTAEAEEFYNANQDMFMTPPSCEASHILVAEEEEAVKIKAMLDNGEKTFEEAAKEFSTCPSSERGGALGKFGRGQMVAEFDTVAFNTEIGKVTDPVKTQFGYHLILVTARDEGSVSTFEEAEQKAVEALLNEKRQMAFAEKIEELKKKYL